MKEIVIDARMLGSSGIGTYIENILRGLSPEVSLIALGDPEKLAPYRHLKDIIPFSAPPYSLQEQIQLPVKVPSCALFWSPHYNVPLAPVRAKKRLVSIHDVYHLRFASTLNLPQKLYARAVMSQAVARSQRIITFSTFSQNELQEFLPAAKQKTIVIPHGVDRERFYKRDAEEIRKKYRLPKSFILALGNLKPHKNLLRLVQACSSLPLPLVIVGAHHSLRTKDEELLAYLQEHPHLQEKVLMMGYVAHDDLPAFYSLATLLVFPSLYEGFGFPLLEAMAAGCPVISSSRASLPEVGGDSILYCDPVDSAAISKAISQMLNNEELRDSYLKKAAERVNLFSWDKNFASHLQLLEELLQ